MITIYCIHGLLLTLLACLYLQDFRDRLISVHLPIAIMLLSGIKAIIQISFQTAFINILLNTIILAFQLSCLFLYLLVTKRKKTFSLNDFLGWVDILFYFAITPLFGPFIFIIYCLLTFSLGSVVTLVASPKGEEAGYQVPLAGISAVLLFFLILFTTFHSFCYYLYDDTIILNLLCI